MSSWVTNESSPTPGRRFLIQRSSSRFVQLVVVGVASRWECLHSLGIFESDSDVRIAAHVGRLASKGSDALGSGSHSVLWTAEVTLNDPLGARMVWACPTDGEDPVRHISGVIQTASASVCRGRIRG
jgi:hypothetical protein